MEKENIGKIVQVIGPIIDVKFSQNNIPDIRNALKIKFNDIKTKKEKELIAEIALQTEGGIVRLFRCSQQMDYQEEWMC